MSFPTISPAYPLILASASPRRKRLLRQVALPFRSRAARVDEGNESGRPERVTLRLAERKAKAAYGKVGDHWVLGADTVVVLEQRILGKPTDRADAEGMLSLLSGREHRVITGFSLLDPSGRPAHAEAVVSLVRMKRLTREEIHGYVATGEPLGKAGSYAIQGIGAFLVEGVTGSYTNVVGLPVCAVIKALLAVGALKAFPLPIKCCVP